MAVGNHALARRRDELRGNGPQLRHRRGVGRDGGSHLEGRHAGYLRSEPEEASVGGDELADGSAEESVAVGCHGDDVQGRGEGGEELHRLRFLHQSHGADTVFYSDGVHLVRCGRDNLNVLGGIETEYLAARAG